MAAPRPRVVVVAEGPPSLGGMSTFALLITGDPVLAESFDVQLLNTTRAAVRSGGTLSGTNARAAFEDAFHTFKAARSADVVHLQTASDPTLSLLRTVVLCWAARLGRARVVVHVHSFAINSGRADAMRMNRFARFLFRRLRTAHSVVTVSDPGRELMRALVPGTRVESMDNAVDVAAFEPARPGDGVPTVLFLGTLNRRKGVPDLVAALADVRSRDIGPWNVVIIGGAAQSGAEETEAVHAEAVAHGFGDALVGAKRGAEVHEALRNASVYVLPSYFEGQPISIIEAMASGLPVVSTRVGAIPDMIREGVEGLLVEPGDRVALADALAELVASPDLRARLGAAARARAEERYSVERLREHLAALYADAVAGR